MTVAHLSELICFLEKIGAAPLKNLSQNFLVDANVIRKIAQIASVQPTDRILEIGPGPGALTQELLKLGAGVVAIEKDRLFARSLSRLQIEGRLTTFESDFLAFPMHSLEVMKPLKIVANLPYHITSPILERLCEYRALFSTAYLMVQKEMAQRMVAQKGTKEMSAFTIFIQTYTHASIVMKVSKHCFYPSPQVDSCLIKLDFRSPPIQDPKGFLIWVQKAFQQRRKMLRSTLKIKQEPFASLRPEALSFEDWLTLYRMIQTDDATNL